MVFELLLGWNLLVNTIYLICSTLACIKMSARSLLLSLSSHHIRSLSLTRKGSHLQGLGDLHIASSIRLLLSTFPLSVLFCDRRGDCSTPAKQLSDVEVWLVWNFYFSPSTHLWNDRLSDLQWRLDNYFFSSFYQSCRQRLLFGVPVSSPRQPRSKCFLTSEAGGRRGFGDLHISLTRLWLSGLVGKGI